MHLESSNERTKSYERTREGEATAANLDEFFMPTLAAEEHGGSTKKSLLQDVSQTNSFKWKCQWKRFRTNQ